MARQEMTDRSVLGSLGIHDDVTIASFVSDGSSQRATMSEPRRTGNPLGELTAEADQHMLETAFYESRSYRELIGGKYYRFVIGRRGTGKSALSRKVSEVWARERGVLLLSEHPQEEKVSSWHSELGALTGIYSEARTIAKLAWKVQVLTQALDEIVDNYKAEKVTEVEQLIAYRSRYQTLFEHSGLARSLEAFRVVMKANPGIPAAKMAESIADHFGVGKLQNLVMAALPEINKRVIFLYDGLDEGWLPTQVSTGLLGGLVKLAAEFNEDYGIRCLLFIRDNMFRALAEFDDDYSRNIEGSTFRLHWDEHSLLNLVALRLRSTFDWRGENDTKTWNRFAKRGLENLEGFRKCLKHTLYRPRDIISLLNSAFQIAIQSGRQEIIDDDVEAAATRISQSRLADLYKEYDKVLPGLRYFAESFRAQAARMPYELALMMLGNTIDGKHAGTEARDFALIRTGSEAFDALYSVGFIGIQDVSGGVAFCHDGSNSDIEALAATRTVVVHPCYWKALDVCDSNGDDVTVRVDDEEDITRGKQAKEQIADWRIRKLGTVIAELERIPLGKPGAYQFEEWVFYTVRYLFSKGLSNIEWHPNANLAQQRDIVGTINEIEFWKRLSTDYDVRQFIIEAKNYEVVDADEFRQAWGYLKGPYGRCLMMITRSNDDHGVTERERDLIKEGYDGGACKLIVLMPAKVLVYALRKMRSKKESKDDYVTSLLGRRLDEYERNYVHLKTTRRRRKRRASSA